MRLEGIHHVTATTGDARANLGFYTELLGLRLVAKSVNQDDPTVYHLFYSDELGSPGADMTFFEYKGARRGRPGAGMVHTVVWQVGSAAALDFWEARIRSRGAMARRTADDALRLDDPEGLLIELLVSDANEPLTANHPEIPQEFALQGLAGVRAYSADPQRSEWMLGDVLGAQQQAPGQWRLGGSQRKGFIALDPAPATRGVQGAGVVHHVAWGTTVADHPAWLQHLQAADVASTPQIDRHYFTSIYFREPGGVLFEIADDEPGFTVDGPVEELGSRVILPPWYEPRREQIEAGLTPLPDPRADWPVGAGG